MYPDFTIVCILFRFLMSILLIFSFLYFTKTTLSHYQQMPFLSYLDQLGCRRVKGQICAARIRARLADERGTGRL